MNAITASDSAVGLIDWIARHTGILAWMRGRCLDGITILMYHKVLPRHLASIYPLRNLVVNVQLFKQQMSWLAENFEVVTIHDAMVRLDQRLGQGVHGQRPLACVTFDDGYRDNFEHASPVLESLGLRATFFVSTGFIEGEALWFDRAAFAWQYDPVAAMKGTRFAESNCGEALHSVTTLDGWVGGMKKMSSESRNAILDALESSTMMPDEIFGPMTIEQIGELAGRGHEIGAHSVTHPILTEISDASLRMEMAQPRARLQAWTGQHVQGFCYPNGAYDERVIAAVREAGYQYGCTVSRGIATRSGDRMALPRRAILSSSRHETIEDGYQSEVVGWHDWLRRKRKRH